MVMQGKQLTFNAKLYEVAGKKGVVYYDDNSCRLM